MSTDGPGNLPDSYTALDRLLTERVEQALRDGVQLERWMARQPKEVPEFPLTLKKPYRPLTLPNRAFGYFGSLKLNGVDTTVVGARQESDFGKAPPGDARELLKKYVLGAFLPKATWTYSDGYKGGFTCEQMLYRTPQGEYGKFDQSQKIGCPDFSKLGSQYDWALITVYIHDFVMKFGPIVHRFNEAATVVLHKDFVHVNEKPESGDLFEVQIGYPFLNYAPIPNSFGFGPGKFGIAVKTYTFRLTASGHIKVEMNFAAGPRCKKVFDFGKRVPDPMYGGASVLSALTLGMWKAQPFHDKVDGGMVAQHSRVHQYLIDGSYNVWNEWLKQTGA